MKTDFHTVYGIEVAAGIRTVVKARRRRGEVDYEVLLNPADPPAKWPSVAAGIAAARRQGGAAVAYAAPASDSFIRPVEVPFPSVAKARAVLPSLLDVQLPFPLEQCVYDFGAWRVLTGGKTSALAIAMLKSRLEEILRDASGLGIDPEFVMPEALALWRFQSMRVPAAGPELRLVLHLAADRTLAVAGRDNRPIASFASRTSWMDPSEASREKLVARLRQFTAGLSRGGDSASEVVISGAGASASAALMAELGVDAAHVKPADAPALIASGTALLALDPDGLPGNLRYGAFESPALADHRQRKNRLALSLVASAAALLLLVTMAAKWAAGKEIRQLDARIGTIAREITGGGQIIPYQELHQVRNDPVIGRWLGADVLPLFAGLVHTSARTGIGIESMVLGPDKVAVQGHGPDWNTAAALTNTLAAHVRWNATVERNDAGPDEKVHFVVRASP